jgi:cellulose biosynthesis protein BcsQ
MFTIAVVNQKGGSGKSTLAQCLAVAAYLDDKGVAILDIDPQGSAYKWAQRRKEKDPNPVVKSVTPANHEDEWQSMKNVEADRDCSEATGFGMAPEEHMSYSAGLYIRARRTQLCSVRGRIDPIPPKG